MIVDFRVTVKKYRPFHALQPPRNCDTMTLLFLYKGG